MKSIYSFSILLSILMFVCVMPANAGCLNVPLMAIVNPSNWGLDNAIAIVVSALVSYILGLFTKTPKINKK